MATLEISSVHSEARAFVGSRPRQWNPLEPDGARSSWPARLRAVSKSHRAASRALGVVVLAASFLGIVVAGVHIRSSEYASCAPRWAWQRWASCASYTCLGGLPQFNTHAELAAHEPWARYFRGVYGSLPRHEGAYPLCVGELWLLYTAGLEAAGVPLADLPETAACPLDDGARHGTTCTRTHMQLAHAHACTPMHWWGSDATRTRPHSSRKPAQAAWRGSGTRCTRHSRLRTRRGCGTPRPPASRRSRRMRGSR